MAILYKKAAVIYANHYLMSKGERIIMISSDEVEEFKSLLIQYCDDKDINEIKKFMKKNVGRNFNITKLIYYV